MPTITLSTEVVLAEPATNERERLALAGFLAGYSGLTRDAYALDLRQFLAWCTGHGTHLFAARRADIECFGRDLEAKGPRPVHRQPASLHRGRLLPLRRGGGAPGPLTGGARAAPPSRLRVACHRS
jgi:hypothetical protein